MTPTGTEAREHGHYFHDVRHLSFIDVYRVCQLFGVEHPALQHALKKVIAAGKRGAKSAQQDAKEAIDSLMRFIEMGNEDNQVEFLKKFDPKEGDEHIRKMKADSNPADPHAALKAIYRPGMRWRGRTKNIGIWSEWISEKISNPAWRETSEYEIHPDDLPKSPDTDGWITVPDDLMEMPEGLNEDDQIGLRFNSGTIVQSTKAGYFFWGVEPNRPGRIKAYRLIKPAE